MQGLSCFCFSRKGAALWPGKHAVYFAPHQAVQPKLTYTEELLIARITPIIDCSVLKYGNRRLSGHVACVSQDVTQIANVLPRLGSEVAMVIFKKQSGATSDDFTTFKVRRVAIQLWLEWLIRYSVAYAGVHIDMDRVPAD